MGIKDRKKNKGLKSDRIETACYLYGSRLLDVCWCEGYPGFEAGKYCRCERDTCMETGEREEERNKKQYHSVKVN